MLGNVGVSGIRTLSTNISSKQAIKGCYELNCKIEEIIKVHQRKVGLNRNGGYTIPLVFNIVLCDVSTLYCSKVQLLITIVQGCKN